MYHIDIVLIPHSHMVSYFLLLIDSSINKKLASPH